MTKTCEAGLGRPSSADPPALIVDHLTKRFGGRVAFDDVSFQWGWRALTDSFDEVAQATA